MNAISVLLRAVRFRDARCSHLGERLPLAADQRDDVQPISATAMGTQEMAKVGFTQNIQRHVTCRETEAAGHNVREVLDNLFAGNPRARSYVLDDQAALRKHMSIYIDGELIRDRVHLSDSVSDTSDIYIFQALSGG